MSDQRTALYVDFDNVFSGLLKLDPEAALSFAEEPGTWLEALATEFTIDGPRRWLVRRCYVNPAGSVADPRSSDSKARLYFSRFRPFFIRSGFEVIDCPALTSRNKNAADIRMALDAMDALGSDTRYDEFVVASADSDLTPLLVRLRAADRRTTIVSPSDAAVAFLAIGDRVVEGVQVLELLRSTVDLPDEEPPKIDPLSQIDQTADADAAARFARLIQNRYADADEPLVLASLAHEARNELGATTRDTRWFGAGSFTKAILALHLPGADMSQRFLWDKTRHQSPMNLPEPVTRVCTITDVPRLGRERWPQVHRILAEYAATHEFSLTEATRWSRDRALDEGLPIARSVFSFVARGSAYGDAPLHRTPPPTSAEIATAFVSNVLSQARAAQVGLTPEEERVVADWLGAPHTTPTDES